MSTQVQQINNFLNYKADFKKDTGHDFNKENMALYISYVSARTADAIYQLNFTIANKVLNDIQQLPSRIRLELADMLRTHETIKSLLQRK
jgi:hypothetical protein